MSYHGYPPPGYGGMSMTYPPPPPPPQPLPEPSSPSAPPPPGHPWAPPHYTGYQYPNPSVAVGYSYPPPPHHPPYQGYFAPPPPSQPQPHYHHCDHDGYEYDNPDDCSSFLRGCLTALCFCCVLEECCG